MEDVVERFEAAVDALLELDLSALSSVQVFELVRATETQRRRLEAVDQRQLAEVTSRGVAGEFGRASTRDLLVEALHVLPAEANRRVAAARDMGPRHDLAGHALEPIFPRIAEAQAVGSISAAHATAIVKTIEEISADLSHEVGPVAEQFLVEKSQHFDPKQVMVLGQRLLARVDPDGVAPREEQVDRMRSWTLRAHPDGGYDLRGRLSEGCGLAIGTGVDALSAPRPGPNGEPDPRTATQRRHDAFEEIALRVLRSGTLPDCGGTPVSIVIRAEKGSTLGTTEHGQTISLATALKISCDPEFAIVSTDQLTGAVLAYHRTRRTASAAQRRALASRDGGCCFPGCTRPASWTEAHHVIPWQAGGRTNLDNLCLLCPYHHRSFEAHGWVVRMVGGVPEWTPPDWVDPQRRPICNTAHHLPEFDFTRRRGRPGPR